MPVKHTETKKAFDLPTLDESLKRDFEAGLISLNEAARAFYAANWTSFVDIKYTRKKLALASI